MEVKKNLNVDTEAKKSSNLLIGLNIALLMTYALMSFTNKPAVVKKSKSNFLNEAVEEIPITQQEPPKAPPPPPSPDIQEIKDDSDQDEDPPPSSEVTENTTITTPVTTKGTDDGKGKVEVDIDNTVYDDVDEQAEFPGGVEKLHEFVNNQFSMPKAAAELGISGVIQIMFTVERDGTIADVRAIAPENRRLGYGLEQECMRILRLSSGKWKPGSRLGKPVRSNFRFPFQIDNSGF